MDIARLGHHLLQTASAGNGSSDSTNMTFTSLPTMLLDTLIPGYSVLSNYLITHLGLDISIIMTILAITVGLIKASSWIWFHLTFLLHVHCMSHVHIDYTDDLFQLVLKWAATQNAVKHARSAKARTLRGSADDQDPSETANASAAVGKDGLFNYSKWQARVPPRYDIHNGIYRFWHKGSFFTFTRSIKKITNNSFWNDQDQETLELSCLGWSTQPVRQLIQDIKIWSIEQQMDVTRIKHATTGRYGGSMRWSETFARPSRPLSTVILDKAQKDTITSDMNEFLHPSSHMYYASRGIPYRRGYLLHGPPGTGKTSLSFALAGMFGLSLFVLSLNDPDMTEGDLRELFNDLPRRCVVLLEDIDEAGVKRADYKAIKEAKEEPKKTELEVGSEKGTLETTKSAEAKPDETISRRDSGVGATDQTSTTINDVKQNENGAPTADGQATLKDDTAKEPDASKPADATIKPTTSSADTQWTLQDLAAAIMRVSPAEPCSKCTDKKAEASDSDSDSDDDDESSTPAPKSRSRRTRRRGPPGAPEQSSSENGISLSGLLNAIDGVATHEGRVLIMTTNHIEALDEALIRTGRVDVRVKFDYANTAQIRELFLRMYAVDVTDSQLGSSEADRSGLDLFEADGIEGKGMDVVEKLREIADEFAQKIPDGVFSPSDVQGYLLLHKKTPAKAARDVERWVEEERKKKAEREKEKEKEEKSAAEKESRSKKKSKGGKKRR